MHRDPVEVEQGRQPEGHDEPHVEQDGGEEPVPAELHHQPCRQGDHERGQDPQPLAPTANPKPVKSAPATAIPAIICTRVRYSPPGSHIAANSVANAAGRKYCCWSNAVRTTNGTSMPPNTTAPLFTLSPARLSANIFASRSIGPPSERRQFPTPANGCPHPSWAVAEPTVHRKPSWTQGSARTGPSARLTDRGEQTPIGALNRR